MSDKYFKDPEMVCHHVMENPNLQRHPSFMPRAARNPERLGFIFAVGNRIARGEEEPIPLEDQRCSFCLKCAGYSQIQSGRYNLEKNS
jgi:hypothetical protein